MGNLLFYHLPPNRTHHSEESQQLLDRSRTLLAAARASVAGHREKMQGLLQRCATTRVIVDSSNEQLRQSARTLFEAWKSSPRRGGDV
jgi:hypothetical protein